MRIAVANWSRREAGGAERYLARVIPALREAGHEIGLFYELDAPLDRGPIPLPEGTPSWSVAELGPAGAIEALRGWRPDLVFNQGIQAPEVEAALQGVADSVLFAHGYLGTCITGAKSFKQPVAMPCGRRFGWECMLHYYPRRCGGRSPLTMIRDFRTQSTRRGRLSGYRAIVTNSAHMQSEFARHVDDPSRVHAVPLPVDPAGPRLPEPPSPTAAGGAWRLLFVGRMTSLKGGPVLLDALAGVAAALGRGVHVTFAGDGPERAGWEARAAEVQARTAGVGVEFVGWLDDGELEALWRRTDLLVVPSLWPEPFGLVGPEAGLRGVPAAAFAVGGIPDWLVEGVGGHLAPGDPPTAAGLADAIVRCLRDPDEHARLRRGARESAARFSQEAHLRALLRIFEGVRSEGPAQ